MTRLDAGFDRALDDLDLRAVTRSPVLEYLGRLLDEYRELDEGEVATYIPELGRADPRWFGICVVTADGHVYEVGDTDLEFTIQSISKPFVFGMALEDQGRDAVLERVGVEPSGNPFNSIVVDDRNRPFNPMVNAGAIVATGLIDAARRRRTRWTRIVDSFSRYAGRHLRARRDRLPLGERDRRPQPRHRAPHAQLRHAARRRRRGDRRVLPAVLAAGDVPRPGDDGGDAREPRARTRSPASARSNRATSRTCSA